MEGEIAMENIHYTDSDSKIVQGKKQDIINRYGKEWTIREQGRGNGNWLLTKRSDIVVDGKSYRNFVLKYYNRQRLTYNLYEQFIQDVKKGKIKLRE